MDTNQTAGSGFWRYLINPDKTATLQLEELCLGLAKIISTLEPGPDNELSPQRLAAFYRAVGGNYDSLFLKPSDLAVSFMYQTLGCFHSLQPTSSPFETPRIPCLTPKGFARWQTIQILLCPEENVDFIQKAVQIWNVPMPNGGIFPKYIPKEVFPSKPDEAMEEWHRMVTGKLNQKHYMQRLKNSPYQSPHLDAYERRDGYFSNGHMGGPSRLAPNNTRADQTRLADSYHRRSSVPDFPSPPSGERYSHWDPRNGPEARKTRSHSAQRPPSQQTRERSHTTSGPPPSHFHRSSGNSPPSGIRGGGSTDRSRRRSSGYNTTNYRSPARTPSTVDEDSGSEASSETSQKEHRHRASDEDPKPRRSSLWMPSFMRSHKRRHSSDASYRAPGPPPPQPLRPEYYPPRTVNPPLHMQQPPYRGGSAPQWREPVWDSDPTISTPGTPVQANAQPDPRAAPTIRYPDQANFEPLTRESSSGSGTDHRHRRSCERERSSAQRRQPAPSAIPSRMATLSGVHGRRYPTPSSEPMAPLDRQRSHASGRGGVATMV